jgi:VWFA-related protein
MNIKPVVTPILFLSLITQSIFGQQHLYVAARLPPAQQEDVVRVNTNLVQVDVIVTDKDGRRVADLRPEDFEIVEGGKKQQITHFSYLDFSGAAASTDEATKTAGQPSSGSVPALPPRLNRSQVRRTFALVADDLGLSFESFGFVKDALRSFVDKQMLPGDLVAVIRTSSGAGASQQFTSDKRQLHAVINRLSWNPKGRGGLSPVTNLNEASAGSDFRDPVQFTEEAEETRAGLYSVGTFGAVGALVQSMADVPGRKSLVFFSEAFRLFQAQGRNVQLLKAMQQLSDQANAASVAIYAVDASGLQTDQFEAADNPAARAYMIDPQFMASSAPGASGGPVLNVNAPPRTLQRADTLSAQAEQDSATAFRRLRALSDQRVEARRESHSVLSFLSASTGGLFLNNRNDLGAAVGRVAEDNGGYYLIAFRPDDASLDPNGRPRMRRLGIKVKRAGLKVRTRSGYASGVDETRRAKPRTRDEQIAAALVSPFAAVEVGLRLTSLFGVETDGSPYLRSLVHVDARDLSFRVAADGKRQAELDMVAVAFGGDGRAVEQLSYPQTVTADNDDAYRRLTEHGLSYVLNMPLKQGGPHQVRVAVRDAGSGKVGAATQYVETPDLEKKRLSLSGVVLSGIPAGAGAAAANSAGDDPRLGPAVRMLPRGTLLDYRYQIYNAQADASGRPQVQTQMRLFRDGRQVFGGRALPPAATGQKDLKRLAAAGRLRLGPELTPGAYLLQVTVTDALAPEKHRVATQWIDFEIVD